MRAQVAKERWEIDCERLEREEKEIAIAEARRAAIAPLQNALRRPALVEAFGGGEAAEKAADLVLAAEQDFLVSHSNPEPSPGSTPPDPTGIAPDQTGSGQIKPDPT